MAQSEAMHGGRRQTRLPIEAIEKTLDILIIERQRLHEQHQAVSRLKQIDARSCTGNANLPKLGGRPLRPLERCHRNGVVTRPWRTQKPTRSNEPEGHSPR